MDKKYSIFFCVILPYQFLLMYLCAKLKLYEKC